MPGLFIAAALGVAAPSFTDSTYPVETNVFRATPVADGDLSRIRGARSVTFSGGRNGVPRLTRDVVVRELAVPRSLMQQQFDNWFVDVGAQLIYDNLTR